MLIVPTTSSGRWTQRGSRNARACTREILSRSPEDTQSFQSINPCGKRQFYWWHEWNWANGDLQAVVPSPTCWRSPCHGCIAMIPPYHLLLDPFDILFTSFYHLLPTQTHLRLISTHANWCPVACKVISEDESGTCARTMLAAAVSASRRVCYIKVCHGVPLPNTTILMPF